MSCDWYIGIYICHVKVLLESYEEVVNSWLPLKWEPLLNTDFAETLYLSSGSPPQVILNDSWLLVSFENAWCVSSDEEEKPAAPQSGHKKPNNQNRTERTGNRNRTNRTNRFRFLFGSNISGTEFSMVILVPDLG
jgi:hypothetical protein